MLDDESRLHLPPVPPALADDPVAAWREPVVIDTYLPDPPDRYPAYLERRVYQGSSGTVYPLPFHERISPTSAPRTWDAIHLQNAWVRLMVLPELGGRIHVGVDRTNGYDFFYRNNVVKPALVGLAGPWISGGVELNWPQHHRPSTFLPTDAYIEHEDDGSVTVWCSEHDPFARMKGMHGVRLRPGSNVVELRVRLLNRTDDVQSFLWWANTAVHVGDDHQSFFPTDVHVVADHAKRAVTAFPAADRPYYGVDYPALVTPDRPDADRLDRYRNIPVPTSYMCLGTQDDFFGGYDHGVGAGLVHWADHRIAPGKKQWTWGDSDFGRAWEANLTDGDGPYVELMAGVFTDNQPDFTFLAPGETKAFSQYWYPYRGIGVVHQATLDAAVHLDVSPDADAARTRVALGVAVTADRPGLHVDLVTADGVRVWSTVVDAGPADAVVEEIVLDGAHTPTDLVLTVRHDGRDLVRWRHRPVPAHVEVPAPAREPAAPADLASAEELHLTATHLEQYRHATRSPEPYWQELLRRDPGDSRAHLALGVRRLRAARYADAERHLRAALARLTALNPNPADGAASYHLGRVLERTGRPAEAREAYGKAAWSAAWRVPAGLATARLDAREQRPADALARATEVLDLDGHQVQARDVAAVALRALGRTDEAARLVAGTLATDPLDWWARDLAGEPVEADAPTCLDVALEHASVGAVDDAARLLAHAASLPTVPGQVNVAPLAHYHRADLLERAGRTAEAQAARQAARQADATWCLPSRLDDVDMLRRTCERTPDDGRAWALLGHWLYAERRYEDAVDAWQRSVEVDGGDVVVRRNLAVAAYDVQGDPEAAAHWYERALALAPGDARLVYESDQLARRAGAAPEDRLARLDRERAAVRARDDLTVEHATLLTALGRADEALRALSSRRFQPWEGGEGQVLRAWEEASLAAARSALADGDPSRATALLRDALDPPASLGEARHPLAGCAHLLLALGDARRAGGDEGGARRAWAAAAASAGGAGAGGTGTTGAVPCSDLTSCAVVALRRLGDDDAADRLTAALRAHVADLRRQPAVVDYFATSLPAMLLFTEDLSATKEAGARLLEAQLAALDGDAPAAAAHLAAVLHRDPVDARALDLHRQLAEHTATPR